MQMVRLLVAAGAKLEFVRRKPPKITPLVRLPHDLRLKKSPAVAERAWLVVVFL
jgi:hypothetical protein